LSFYNPGAFDIYSQTIPTKAGRSYSLDFLYTNDFSGILIVTATPLPSSFTIFAIGMLALGLVSLGCRRATGNSAALAAA
jgi:hypothetical protein